MEKNEAADPIELRYQERMDALTPKERVARAAAIFQWTREAIARRIIAEMGPMEPKRIKWLIALRQYGADIKTRKMIQKVIEDVSC